MRLQPVRSSLRARVMDRLVLDALTLTAAVTLALTLNLNPRPNAHPNPQPACLLHCLVLDALRLLVVQPREDVLGVDDGDDAVERVERLVRIRVRVSVR